MCCNHDDFLLEVTDLCVVFSSGSGVWPGRRREVRAVDRVSFHVDAGETLGLVGESGSGKSTTARAILRLIHPASGRISFCHKAIGGFRGSSLRTYRKEVQVVFQDTNGSLNPRMRVGRCVAEPLILHESMPAREVTARVSAALERVGLDTGLAGRYPHELSGGQRQRVCIARALMLRPKLIILDEAVSALDLSVQAQILNLLLDLKRERGLAYLFISHDLAVVRYMSDRIAVMRRGSILETGTPDDVFDRPGNPYTRALIAAIPKAVVPRCGGAPCRLQ